MGTKKEKQTSEMVRWNAISNWSAVFGAPEITVADIDSRFFWEVFLEFCTARDIILQVVIPGHRPSLGATELRRGLFRTIIDHSVANRKPNSLGRTGWEEFAEMTTMRFNSRVRQFGGFASGRRVFGRAPKMPIVAVGNPNFGDFANPKEALGAKTHHLLGAIQEIRQSSLNADFRNKLHTAWLKRIRETRMGLLSTTVGLLLSTDRMRKSGRKRSGPGVITGRSWGEYALVHFRWAYLEVDLDDMLPSDRLFEILGRDGPLQLHLPSAKFPIHCLVGSQPMISFRGWEMGF